MTFIDIRTIFTGFVLSILLCVIVMASLWWQNRKRSPEIALWLADYVLQFIGLLLITVRGILPDFFTIILSNLFIIGGTVVLYIGLGRYVGKERRQSHNYIMLVVFTIVQLYLTYVHPDIELRTVNISLALIYICAQGAWLMMRDINRGLRPATRVTGIVFTLFCLISAVQIGVNLSLPKVNNLFVSGFFGVVAIFIYQILFIALTFSLFLMVGLRLASELEGELAQCTDMERELRQSEEKFAKAFQTSPSAIGITRIEDGKFLEVNDAFVSLTGYSRQEIMSETSFGIKLWVNEKDREEIVSILRRGMPVVGKETMFRKKNGDILTGFYSAQMIQVDDEPCILSSLNDVTESRRAEALIRLRLSWQEFAVDHSLEEVLQKTLDEIGALVESPIGFYHFVEKDQKTLSLQAWSTRTVKEFCKSEGKGMHYSIDQAGVWVDCVREKRAVIHNDYSSLPHRKGLPEGHAPIVRELVVPIMRGGSIMAILGVGNKSVNYTGKDVEIVSYLSDVSWEIIKRKQAEEGLRESEASIRAITNSAHDAITMMDNEGNISYWNPAAERILGYTREEAIGKNVHELIAPERFIPAHHAAFSEFQQTGQGNAIGKTLELVARRKDGQEIDVALSLSAVKIKETWHAVGIIQDITERKQAQDALAQLSRQNELILNSAAEGILGLDLNGNHTFVNSAAARMFGCEVQEMIGRPSHSIWHHTKSDGSPYPETECEILTAHKDGAVHRVSTEVFWRKDGTSFPVEYASTPIYEQGRTTGVVVTFADITERKRTEEQIKHLATHDLLTDLPSLNLAKDRLSSALNMARRYKKAAAVMFIDLDGFKTVNDTLGHDAGDYVLKTAAQRMVSCVRETDTVARVGGDEFLIIATEINAPENAAQIAEKIIRLISLPITVNGHEAVVGASIGIAMFPAHGDDMDLLIKLADQAMYEVKNSGKNGFRFINQQ